MGLIFGLLAMWALFTVIPFTLVFIFGLFGAGISYVTALGLTALLMALLLVAK